MVQTSVKSKVASISALWPSGPDRLKTRWTKSCSLLDCHSATLLHSDGSNKQGSRICVVAVQDILTYKFALGTAKKTNNFCFIKKNSHDKLKENGKQLTYQRWVVQNVVFFGKRIVLANRKNIFILFSFALAPKLGNQQSLNFQVFSILVHSHSQ